MQALGDDILLHGKEVDRIRDTGRDLCDEHDDVKKDVNKEIRKYLQCLLPPKKKILPQKTWGGRERG